MATRLFSLPSLTGASTVTRAFLRSQNQIKNSYSLVSRVAPPAFAIQQPIRRTIATDLERKAMDKDQSRGTSTEGESEWKKRAPYKIHESNDNFPVKYEASCHCGKVKYQLSREEPLDSKLCHCTTCQTQHGKLFLAFLFRSAAIDTIDSCTFPMGCNFPQGRHQLLTRPPQPRVVRPNG